VAHISRSFQPEAGSPKGEIVYVQFKPGKQELWLMDFLNR